MFLRKVLLISALSIFALSALGYGAYKAMPILLGPKIEISSPQNGDIVDGTNVILRGNVYRVKSLFVNSIPTAFTDNGSFETKLPVYPGSNIIILTAKDRFGRSISQTLNLGTK